MKRLISAMLIVASLLSLSACSKKEDMLKEEDIRSICELATIECYYNNVAQIEKSKDNIFQKDRKMWIEYEGVATLGIDMDLMKIKIKDDNVTIYLPKAKIITITPNRKTLNEKSYVASSDGFLFKNKITTEDQNKAIKKGQKEMRKAIEENKSLFTKASTRAKELIGNYITKIGKLTNHDYNIKWKEIK